MENKVFYGVLALVVLAVLFYVFGGSITGNVVGAVGDVEISLDEISESAKFYDIDGVRFFAVRAEDGLIKTAFDACDVCYGSKKGYRQEGAYMVCNNCGNKYPISGLGTENLKGGGCWPGYLPSKIVGENLVIKKKDIEKERYRF